MTVVQNETGPGRKAKGFWKRMIAASLFSDESIQSLRLRVLREDHEKRECQCAGEKRDEVNKRMPSISSGSS